MLNIVNAIIFYVGWYLLVANHNLTAGVIGACLAFVNVALKNSNIKVIMLMMLLAMVGVLTDFIAYELNIFKFTYIDHFWAAQNLWLYSIWLLFLTTFEGPLIFLKSASILILILLGMFGGGISYYLAYKLNAIDFYNTKLSLGYISVSWSIIFTIIYKLYFMGINYFFRERS